jgi:hypothetical protein
VGLLSLAGVFEMTEIQLNHAIEPQFYGVSSCVPVRSTDGNVIGHYLPEEEYLKLLYASFKMPFSEEEIARRRSETGGHTLEEIWKRLGQS